MTYNEILLSGEINNIIINNRYITLGITCKKYSPNENSNIVYASLRVYKDLYENNKGIFLLGKNVYLKGYLNSYADKNKIIHNYVTVTKIDNFFYLNYLPTITNISERFLLCKAHFFPYDYFEKEVLEELNKLLSGLFKGLSIKKLNNGIINKINSGTKSLDEIKKDIEKDIVKLTANIQTVYQDRIDGNISLESYKMIVSPYEQKMRNLKDKLEEIELEILKKKIVLIKYKIILKRKRIIKYRKTK